MCEQTEIHYLDGDVVWVKLGSAWWPGQVVGFEKLPEDVQREFQRKPLIAAVKFFQEESFEFVKNYQQIYKYNCTQKEDFIRKGLDKYRAKSKDNSNYMDKFPQDVKTAETLTNGNPNILSSEKFNPEQKPDISGLFGEKKISKKKRNQDDPIKKMYNDVRRVTHPRFLQENDHEIRIRKQPKTHPSTPGNSSSAGIFPCQICGFTATRVNVIIFHLKSHRLNNETAASIKSKAKANVQSKSKQTTSDSPKRKYVKKSVPGKSKNENKVESFKRKQLKQIDKPNKKKKSDPELREKLLADWNIDSEEDESSDFGKSIDTSSVNLSSKSQPSVDSTDNTDIFKEESDKDDTDNMDLLHESNKLLLDTDSYAKLSTLKCVSTNIEKIEKDENDIEQADVTSSPKHNWDHLQLKKPSVEKSPTNKEDKNSRLSCFDFDEDDIPEPNISSVRKIPRSLGSKNMSIKKEIIKEFEMSQALKNDAEKDIKNDENIKLNLKKKTQSMNAEEEKLSIKDNEETVAVKNEENKKEVDDKKTDKTIEICETQVEIVEIFEVHKEEDKDSKREETEKFNEKAEYEYKHSISKEQDDINKTPIKEKFIEEPETPISNIAEEQKMVLDIQDADGSVSLDTVTPIRENVPKDNLNSCTKKRRGRPRKNLTSSEEGTSDNEHIKIEKKDPVESDRKTSESDSDRSSGGRIRKPNTKYQSLYLQSFENRSSKTDESLSESDDKPERIKNKTRKGRKSKSYSDKSVVDKVVNLKSPENHVNDNITVKSVKTGNTSIQDLQIEDVTNSESKMDTKKISVPSDCNNLKEQPEIIEDKSNEEGQDDIGLLPPKKSQIKKTELTSMDSSENNLSTCSSNITNETNLDFKEPSKNVSSEVTHKDVSNIFETTHLQVIEEKINEKMLDKIGDDNLSIEQINSEKNKSKSIAEKLDIVDKTDYEKNCPSVSLKVEKKKLDDNEKDSIQNKIIDTEPIENLTKLENINVDSSEISKFNLNSAVSKTVLDENSKNLTQEPIVTNYSIVDNFDSIEIVVADNAELEVKSNEVVSSKNQNMILSSNDTSLHDERNINLPVVQEKSPIKKINQSLNLTVSPVSSVETKDIIPTTIAETKVTIPMSVAETKVAVPISVAETNVTVPMSTAETKVTDPVSMVESEATVKESRIETKVTVPESRIETKVTVPESRIETKVTVPVSVVETKVTVPVSVVETKVTVPVSVVETKVTVPESRVESKVNVPVSIAETKVNVPVKKREKPRIIENVALKEPMILKTKLMDKHTGKFGKHKLESDNVKLNDLKSCPKTKVMRMETVISSNKNKSPLNINQNLVTKKITKLFKTEDGLLTSSLNDSRGETNANILPTPLKVPSTEKCIQQSSQSLVDMELDINSMPFVLSEDVLTPESIEQMPVVISSVLPKSNTITTALPTTLVSPRKQIINADQSFESPSNVNEINLKKKSGTPTILKSKSKAKPTITSIKNVVPPLPSATYKGGFKMNAQALKTTVNQKTSGKYVIVQTGHQQAYSTHPKIAIPTSKGSSNAQIVQQGGKVVILTSPPAGQSGQKVLPLNSISKGLSSPKIQRIITTKHGQQVLTPVSSKNILTSKGKELSTSPTTSKTTGQKIISPQQQIMSKSVLTQMPGTITKSASFGPLSQGIITKDGIFTPISSTIGGKTFISSKTLVAKGYPTQSSSTSKNILSPITQSISSKTIINSQGIVSKGTVLTPITGSQVKALAAKNIKGNKLQNQAIQRKVQSIETQKSPKIPISSTPARNTNVVVLQNADVKTLTPSKKNIKQIVQKQAPVTGVLPSDVITMQHKGKVASSSLEQKVISPKTITRTLKLPTKVVKDKTVESILPKPIDNETLSSNIKKIESEKQTGSSPVMKFTKSASKNLQKKVSNVANSTVPTPSNANISLPVTIPPLEPTTHEKAPNKDIPEQIMPKEQIVVPSTQTVTVSEPEKIDDTKVPVQAQIMALPTENSDGTQSFVLFTVDEQGQGHIIPLDNNALMSLDGTTTIDGNRTIYIDSSSLGETGSMDNIVLQIDNSSLTDLQPTTSSELTSVIPAETVPSSDISQPSNQDILAAALANTDFQHEIGVTETTGSTSMTTFTQTSLINQTILQSTIIPPTEPISSPLVLETSLTLNQPIMTPLEVPSSLPVQTELTPVTSSVTMPANSDTPLIVTENSTTQLEETLKTSSINKTVDVKITSLPSKMESKLVSDVTYSISIPENDFDNKQSQSTPSMPLIDDSFNANNGFDSTNASIIVENNLRNFVSKTSEELIQDLTGNDSSQENSEMMCSETATVNNKACSTIQEKILETPKLNLNDTQDNCVSSQENITLTIEPAEEIVVTESTECSKGDNKEILNKDSKSAEICTISSESPIEVQSSREVQEFNVTGDTNEEALTVNECTLAYKEEVLTSNQDLPCEFQSVIPSTKEPVLEMIIDGAEEHKTGESVEEEVNACQTSNSPQRGDSNHVIVDECKESYENGTDTSREAPSQSYEQLVSATSDVAVPSQSVKTEVCREATQSLTYEAMDIDDNALTGEPPTQSYEDSKENEASQSYKALHEINTNAPTQSFNEMMEVSEERESIDESMNDPNFPTQSYEVEKQENIEENLETDTETSQEGNIPSQSNDIGVDGIGTSSVSTNNSGLNEDETASSSYVPETPENQERDQDQESAISTSSYEIPPCEELNIASSSVIPDTSVQSEHSSIHNNGVLEIPTSSYNLNPDSSSAHVDAVPTSSYEDQIVIEQNVSTSYEVPISMANIEETGTQNYVTDSSDERNEATSYYGHNREVTESYYENICKQSHSQLESNSEDEATPSYYESNPADVTSEASGSYFNQEEATPSYSNHEISASYYDPRAESEASQSYYSSTHDLNTSSQSTALQNVEATQSFYNENPDEQRLRQQGEATPTYTERYSVDYAPVSSPLDRHDLVESSVPARSMDR